ncbi:MAG: nitroreductase family protein [Methanomassiliicoccaceae archaeon]|nr:nitroreductase family protein [Methanomassiliicoccaceae archaeon]
MLSNTVLRNIYERRSIRSYSDRIVADEDVRELIKAGFHAANGMNVQKLRFSVVADKEKLRSYSCIGKRSFLEYMKAESIRNSYLEKNLNSEEFNIFYDAPAAIFIYGAPGIFTAKEDASLAAGNIMLAARSMGIGTCWIGLAAGLDADGGFMSDNNVPADHKLLAAIILGYPACGFPEDSQRPEPQILNWIR